MKTISIILGLTGILAFSPQTDAQKWKDKLKKLTNPSETGSSSNSEASPSNKKGGFSEVYLKENGQKLTTLKLGAEYDIEIIGVDASGNETSYLNPNPNGIDFGAQPKKGDWKVNVEGGDWDGTYYKLKAPNEAADLVDNQIILKLAHKSDFNKVYEVKILFADFNGFKITHNTDEKGDVNGSLTPGGFVYLDLIPLFNNTPDPSRANTYGKEGVDYVFNSIGAEYYNNTAYGTTGFRINDIPFGTTNENNTVKIEVLSPDKISKLGAFSFKLDYKADFSWKAMNLSGTKGSDNRNGAPGKNASPITVNIDTYDKIAGKELVIVEVIENSNKHYGLIDPKGASITINNSGGTGGSGGDTRNAGNAGNGGNGGNGGAITLNISPEAQKLNLNIELLNNGGNGGSRGLPYGSDTGQAGTSGSSGKAGPAPVKNTKKVNITF